MAHTNVLQIDLRTWNARDPSVRFAWNLNVVRSTLLCVDQTAAKELQPDGQFCDFGHNSGWVVFASLTQFLKKQIIIFLKMKDFYLCSFDHRCSLSSLEPCAFSKTCVPTRLPVFMTKSWFLKDDKILSDVDREWLHSLYLMCKHCFATGILFAIIFTRFFFAFLPKGECFAPLSSLSEEDFEFS